MGYSTIVRESSAPGAVSEQRLSRAQFSDSNDKLSCEDDGEDVSPFFRKSSSTRVLIFPSINPAILSEASSTRFAVTLSSRVICDLSPTALAVNFSSRSSSRRARCSSSCMGALFIFLRSILKLRHTESQELVSEPKPVLDVETLLVLKTFSLLFERKFAYVPRPGSFLAAWRGLGGEGDRCIRLRGRGGSKFDRKAGSRRGVCAKESLLDFFLTLGGDTAFGEDGACSSVDLSRRMRDISDCESTFRRGGPSIDTSSLFDCSDNCAFERSAVAMLSQMNMVESAAEVTRQSDDA